MSILAAFGACTLLSSCLSAPTLLPEDAVSLPTQAGEAATVDGRMVTYREDVPAGVEPKPAKACERPTLDLAETELGYYLQATSLWRADGQGAYIFTVMDNAFDPCAELSWVVLKGAWGNSPGYVSPGAMESPSYVVAFFRGEHLVLDQPLDMVPNLPGRPGVEVTCTGDTAATVTYGVAGRSLAEGIVGETSASYELVDGAILKDGAHAEQELLLDKALPGARAYVSPYGNARYVPWTVEADPAENYTVPLGDGEKVVCSVYRGGEERSKDSEVSCIHNEGLFFPQVDSEHDYVSADPAATTMASMYFDLPYRVYSSPAVQNSFTATESLPDEAVIRIGDYFYDTRGPGLTVSDGSSGFYLAEGVIEHADPVVPLDRSRVEEFAGTLRSFMDAN